jgi:hypothetical protein
MAADNAGIGNNFTAAGQSKIIAQMFFLRHGLGKSFHPLGDFNDTFLALAIFAAGRRHVDAKCFGIIEKRRIRLDDSPTTVEM